jgi:hypothetical protein
MINHDKTLYKETYGIISFSIGKDIKIGDYRFRVEATDSNKKGERIGRTPYMHFYVYEDATLYPPINYTYSNLTVEPNPAVVGTTVKVTVTVNVTNLGGKGNWKGETVYLDVNGTEVKAAKTLKLANDENTTVTFRLTKKELGEVPASVNVSIGGLNETLILKEKAPPPTTTPGSGGTAAGGEEAVPGFTAVSVIAALCFVVIYRRLSRKGR